MLAGKHVLLVEDDDSVMEVVKATLSREQVSLDICTDGISGYTKSLDGDYDLVILDIMLPKQDGLEICKQLRENNFYKPIIMLTAKASELDRVLGLELGANDYITKPFSPREFVARCKAALRGFQQGSNHQDCQLVVGSLVIKEAEHWIGVNGVEIRFTPKEFDLLVLLATHQQQIFTRDQILNQLWEYTAAVELRTVDEHIKRIRQKLMAHKVKSVRIQTLRGIGYQLRVES